MRIVYFDCTNGFCAGSALAALIGAGADGEIIRQALTGLNVTKCNIDTHYFGDHGVKVEISGFEEKSYRPDEINRIITNSPLDKKVIFQFNKVLGKLPPMDRVSTLMLIKIFGVIYSLENLGVKKVYTSPLPVGHSYNPKSKMSPPENPIESFKGYPVIITHLPEPLISPCGAAVISALALPRNDLSPLSLEQIGYGMMKYPVRALVGTLQNNESQTHKICEDIIVAETAIDDMDPEFYPYILERLLEAGALDVYQKPVLMKKGRSGMILTVLSHKDKLDGVLEIIFAETSTLGIRVRTEQRVCLKRDFVVVETPYGCVRVKLAYWDTRDHPFKFAPEFEECKARAQEKGVPVQAVYRAALSAAEAILST